MSYQVISMKYINSYYQTEIVIALVSEPEPIESWIADWVDEFLRWNPTIEIPRAFVVHHFDRLGEPNRLKTYHHVLAGA